MFIKNLCLVITCFSGLLLPVISQGSPRKDSSIFRVSSPKITMTIDCDNKASITSLVINGQEVISSKDGIYTAVKAAGMLYSSMHLKEKPVVQQTPQRTIISGISYGNENITIQESWIFTRVGEAIQWEIKRALPRAVKAEEAGMPVLNFNNIDTWEGAYQGYGGLAWFYLFNEKESTYGVHTRSSNFWNSKSGNGLTVAVDAPGKQVAMKYSRTNDNRLAYTVTVSNNAMIPGSDSGTNRRLFVRNRTDVWAPFTMPAGASTQRITFSYFDFNEKYGRGKFAGINGTAVSAVLNTIARIGVIDSLHFGGNSWHTPYGPICLHEQYIAQMGLGINDPDYLSGYQSCLDYYRDHAIKPDGRVYSRWAYTNEDAMPGAYNKEGFYEAQWGILMDSNPDFVTNVAELYDMTGNKSWVKSHQRSCEKALDWILKRDVNNNGLVEMMTDSQEQKRSSDWIDIIWASYENAFVNAKLYLALTKWAAIEGQLGNPAKEQQYKAFAAKLKSSFNKPVSNGGFWDQENQCYVHWLDKAQQPHGRNMVTPVNFMAIAYGICDDASRAKLILDNIEQQMVKEQLFFWPLAMTSYAAGEGRESQYPFPEYENGDLFLSWGSVAIKAYAAYDPEIALKYVKNVLEQYNKDGLAFQRYGRIKQDGRGDDILSGNSLSIVGLYQAIYGINPLYNRLLLDPHITPALAGTELNYNYQHQRLLITLDHNSYSVSNKVFKISSPKRFGFKATKNNVFYFDDDNSSAALQVTTNNPLTINIKNWNADNMSWTQTITAPGLSPLTYNIHGLQPGTEHTFSVDGKAVKKVRSDGKGDCSITYTPVAPSAAITISN